MSGKQQYGRLGPAACADLFSPACDELDTNHLPAPRRHPAEQVAARFDDTRDWLAAARDMVLTADSSSTFANAIAEADVWDRLASLATARKQEAITLARDHADESLLPTVGTEVDEYGDAPKAERAVAWALGPALTLTPGHAARTVRDAVRLVEVMPNAHQRLLAGDWTPYHQHIAQTALVHLDDETVAALDADVFSTPGRVAAWDVDRAIVAWLRAHDEPLMADRQRRQGVADRFVGFGPVDLFGMRPLGGYLRAVDAAVIDTCLNDLANTRDPDDPRTHGAAKADALVALFTGPAALTTAIAAHAMTHHEPVLPDPDGHQLTADGHSLGQQGCSRVGADGYRAVHTAESALAAETWAVIVMLAATLGLTFPTPPSTTLNLHVPLDTLTGLRDALRANPATGPPDVPPTYEPLTPTSPSWEPSAPLDGTAMPTAADRLPGEPARGPMGRPSCFIPGIGTIPDELAWLLATHADGLRRIITDPVTGQVVDYGTLRREPSTAMAARTRLNDGCCRYPGCHRPAQPARNTPTRVTADGDEQARRVGGQIDHVKAYASGGHTADVNLQLLCADHHRAKHQTHWMPVMDPWTRAITWRNRLLGITRATHPHPY